MKERIREYFLKDDSIFPNSDLPVLYYPQILKPPFLFPGRHVKQLFQSNGWANNWRHGIYTYHHYHSITHEAMGVIKGSTTLLLGGEGGIDITIHKGDIIVIPAGVAHKNLCKESDVTCIGGYPDGRDYDMNYGKPGERPGTDKNIAVVPLPDSDPFYGRGEGLTRIWHR